MPPMMAENGESPCRLSSVICVVNFNHFLGVELSNFWFDLHNPLVSVVLPLCAATHLDDAVCFSLVYSTSRHFFSSPARLKIAWVFKPSSELMQMRSKKTWSWAQGLLLWTFSAGDPEKPL